MRFLFWYKFSNLQLTGGGTAIAIFQKTEAAPLAVLKMDKKRGADPIDCEVGRRIKMQRRMLGFSQSQLGDFIGITFQQVQKYEKGMNRVSSSRLQQIANVLGVPVSFFFDGVESPTRQSAHQSPFDLASISGGVRLAKAFSKIKHQGLRKDIVELVACIADYGESRELP